MKDINTLISTDQKWIGLWINYLRTLRKQMDDRRLMSGLDRLNE
ncbi:hypothetical protein ACRYI5_07865 [Furfurilactobacillus sp. WILCCON 0119]